MPGPSDTESSGSDGIGARIGSSSELTDESAAATSVEP